jgi:DNA-binding MarR family transcriptional regulator
MTPKRRRESERDIAPGSSLSYFAKERPIGLLVANLNAVYQRAFLQRLSTSALSAPISAADHAILRCIAQGIATSTEIARVLGVSKQAIGKTVSSLERRRYLARSVNDADRRASIVTMSAQGKGLVERSIRAAKELDARALRLLGKRDLARLKAWLSLLRDEESRSARAERR